MSCRAGPSLRVLYRVKDDRRVRESLWEAFSKCPCPGMAKGKSRYSGGHSNYKQICQRTQEHHLLISISTGPQARGSPHLISYCTQTFSNRSASRISCLSKGFPITLLHRGIQPRFCQTSSFGSVSLLRPLPKKG